MNLWAKALPFEPGAFAGLCKTLLRSHHHHHDTGAVERLNASVATLALDPYEHA